jgi:uncharacterized protein
VKQLLVLLGFFVCALSHGASFDCKAAAGSIEKLICSDPELSGMDEQLASAYRIALASLAHKDRKLLIAEQKSWLRNSRSLCADLSCLRRSYEARLRLVQECRRACSNLVESYDFRGDTYNLVTVRNANSNNPSFNQDLLKRGRSPVLGCDILIDIAVGTAHGNHSYGGVCRLKNEQGVSMICSDVMIGHFKVAKAFGKTTTKDLAEFTIENCFGG